ncbi:hypothetical protein ACTVH1_03470 [Gluconobacter cerinus]|uniref:hypothetical protein n=1 Tax=Gluconobacter cerinus TaxID=38307 RepID=UPI0039E81569
MTRIAPEKPFTVLMFGSSFSHPDSIAFATYGQAEKEAEKRARDTLVPHDIYFSRHLISCVTNPNFAGNVTVEPTPLGQKLFQKLAERAAARDQS